MHEWATLGTREDGFIDGFGQFFLAEDHPTARTTQGFMSGRGDNVGIFHRVWTTSGSHDTGDMGHIYHHQRTDFITDLTNAGKINNAWISAGASHDKLRLASNGFGLHGIVIDGFGFRINAVFFKMIELAAEVDRRTMGEMAAMAEVHAQHGIPRFEHSLISGEVCLGTAVRLHIGMFGTKQFFGAIAGNILNHVHIFAATIIALARISFSIFVCQAGALRRHHSAAGKVFRSDQLDLVALALEFMRNGFSHSRILWRKEFSNVTHWEDLLSLDHYGLMISL